MLSEGIKVWKKYFKVDLFERTINSRNNKLICLARRYKAVTLGRIISNRRLQNIFVTLVNSKGDVISNYSLGYFQTRWAKKLYKERRVAHKAKALAAYRKHKRQYHKAKADLMRSFSTKELRILANKFCSRAIRKLRQKAPYIKALELVFIKLDNHLKFFVDIYIKRFKTTKKVNRTFSKNTLTIYQVKQLYSVLGGLWSALSKLIAFLVQNKSYVRSIAKKIMANLINSYLVIKLIKKNKSVVKRHIKSLRTL